MNTIESQYRTSENLDIRIAIHARYSTNPQPFGEWVSDHYELQPGFRILETGCGTGEMWKGRLDRLPKNCHLMLTDFSKGMLETARNHLGDNPQVSYQQADIQALPYEDGAFDAVIANMMLYHVPDLHKGLQGVRRVLKPGGTFYCATYGERGIMAFINETLKEHGIQGSIGKTFTLQNGAQALEQHFAHVRREDRKDGLAITHVPDFVEYVLSMASLTGLEKASAKTLQEVFERQCVEGVLYVPKEYGMFICE